MKIMVFLHGTTIMHRSAIGKSREERVRQVVSGDESVRDFASYVPTEDAPRKLQSWCAQGAEILYLSSHREPGLVDQDRSVLKRYGFPEGPVYYRQEGESYADVAAKYLPDVLVEDDCESIGGEPEMTFPHLPFEARAKIRSIVVKEFAGLEDLPEDVRELVRKPGSV